MISYVIFKVCNKYQFDSVQRILLKKFEWKNSGKNIHTYCGCKSIILCLNNNKIYTLYNIGAFINNALTFEYNEVDENILEKIIYLIEGNKMGLL